MIRRGRWLGALPIVLLLAGWQILSMSGVYPPILLPSPAQVATVFTGDWTELFGHAAASIGRVALGVAVAFATAVPLGLLIGRYRTLDLLADWSVQIFRSFPPIALIPLAILFFGIGDKPAIMLIIFGSFWPLLLNTIFGVRSVDRTVLRVARVAQAREWLVFAAVIVPSALPAILTGLRLAIGTGWLTVVTAEMIAVKSGLGYMILNAQLTFRADLIFAGILIIGAIGLLCDTGVQALRSRLCRWQVAAP